MQDLEYPPVSELSINQLMSQYALPLVDWAMGFALYSSVLTIIRAVHNALDCRKPLPNLNDSGFDDDTLPCPRWAKVRYVHIP